MNAALGPCSMLALVACGACRNPIAPPPDEPVPPVASSPDAQRPPPSTLPSTNALAVQASVAEMQRASDVKNFALTRDQSPPPGFVPLSREAPRLPQGYARVVGYVVNFDRGLKHNLGSERHGCVGAVAADGTLCPSVVLPGVELSAAQATELEQLASSKPTIPRVSSCAGRAYHSFVFYDAAGVPVFEYLLNLRCGRGSQSPWILSEATLDGLVGLCRELGLGLCFMRDRELERESERAFAERYVERLPGTAERLPGSAHRLLPYATSVSSDRRVDSLSPGERRELCAWNIQHTMSWLEPGGAARQSDAGAQTRLKGFVECSERFPKCSATLDELLPCVTEAQRGAPVFADFSPSCSERSDCLWGFEIGSRTQPAPQGD